MVLLDNDYNLDTNYEKKCPICGNIFSRKLQSDKLWAKAKYCSKKCTGVLHRIDVSSGFIKCHKCNEVKPLSEYKKRNESYYGTCKDCLNKSSKRRNKLRAKKKSKSQLRFDQLSLFEAVRFNSDGYIEVKCKRSECRQWFAPTQRHIEDRVRSFNGTATGGSDHNFYCSDHCRDNCDLYRKNSNSEINALRLGMSYDEYFRTKSERDQFVWNFVRDKVLELDDHCCCVCGSKEGVEVHHQIPAALNPMVMYDPDNLITLCNKCHLAKHRDHCTFSNIAKRSCHKVFYNKQDNGLPDEWLQGINLKRFGKKKEDLSG